MRGGYAHGTTDPRGIVTNDYYDSRGDLIAAADEPPRVTSDIEATVCWFGNRPLRVGDRLRPGLSAVVDVRIR